MNKEIEALNGKMNCSRWTQLTFVACGAGARGAAVGCRMFGGFPGLCSLETSSAPHPPV